MKNITTFGVGLDSQGGLYIESNVMEICTDLILSSLKRSNKWCVSVLVISLAQLLLVENPGEKKKNKGKYTNT